MEKLAAAGIETFEMDVTEVKSIEKVKGEVEELTGGTLDMLVNNACVTRQIVLKFLKLTSDLP